MHADDAKQLEQYLRNLVITTGEGKIRWSQVNPSTYVYDPVQRSGKILLQKINNNPVAYLFQVFSGSTMTLEVQGSPYNPQSATFNVSFDELFKIIERLRDQEGLNTLKSLLP